MIKQIVKSITLITKDQIIKTKLTPLQVIQARIKAGDQSAWLNLANYEGEV